jgi:hypothetical protein
MSKTLCHSLVQAIEVLISWKQTNDFQALHIIILRRTRYAIRTLIRPSVSVLVQASFLPRPSSLLMLCKSRPTYNFAKT